MSPEAVTGLVVGLLALLGGLAAILGWRSGERAMPVPSPTVASGHAATHAREAERVTTARRDQGERAQELRNASNTPDRDVRSDELATVGNRRARR